MSKHNSFIATVDQVISTGIRKGIGHLYTQNEKLTNNLISLKGKEIINFGSCSYLGLEFNKEMILASQQAVADYGTTFAESRAYVSIKHYEILEGLFSKIFNFPAIVAPTTTLAHIAAIPVLVNEEDAIILDHQVHTSVQTAVSIVKSRGVHVELLRHNRMDLLEERIKLLRKEYSKIWYMGDGIYSMYGDLAPIDTIHELLNKYPEFHYYVDDAHGMSVYGKNGCGYVLSRKPLHDKMIMATSLAKGFATGGAVLVFPNKELCGKVRRCGTSFITSGPMQPSQLGAAIASAKIHLSDELYTIQEDLHENIKYANLILKKYKMPLVAETDSPVFFVGVGLPKLGYNMVKRMLDSGYYVNIGIFPAVPIKNTGIRFTITRLHTFQQIESMIATMAYHFPLALQEEGMEMKQIYQSFKMQSPEEKGIEQSTESLFNQLNLYVENYKSITQINQDEWNNLLGNRGTFDWNGLNLLEKSFSNNELPENNWEFDYTIIKDPQGTPILATFLTASIAKDDMLSPASVSEQIESIRKADNPYYLTSKVLSLGSPLTEGNHLYLDRTSPFWKNAMKILFDKITELQELYKVNTTIVRDFPDNDEEMDAFLIDNGFFKIAMPDNHIIENLGWENKEEFKQLLSSNSRENFKRYIQRYEDKFEIEVIRNPGSEELSHFYELYTNVKIRSMVLNTFTLPYKLFEMIAISNNWEILSLKIKDEYNTGCKNRSIAMAINYINGNEYNFVIVGMNYNFLDSYKCYKQLLYRTILRAKELNLKSVKMGFTSSFEKRKLGARVIPTVAYMQTKDTYGMQVLGNISIQRKEKIFSPSSVNVVQS